MRFWIIAVGCVTLAGGASAVAPSESTIAERIERLFGMSEAQFDRQLAERFQYPPPSPPPPAVDDQRQGHKLDAAYFELFPELDRSYPPSARAQAKRLARQLTSDASNLSHEQFVLRVAEIAALADNAHTSVSENAWRKNTPRLPIRTFLFADGLYVLNADPANADLLGARIDAIAGQSIESIYRTLGRYMGGLESRRRLQLIPMLESPAILKAAGLPAAKDRLVLKGVLADGTGFERTIAAEERGRAAWVSSTIRLLFPASPSRPLASFIRRDRQLPVYLKNSNKLFAMENLPAGGLYLGITHNGDGDEEKIAPFLANALSRIRTGKPAYVVVDMRMNGGGDYTATYDFARSLPEASGGSLIYVLTSPWTFSAAITTVAALKDAGGEQVRIVGEPVGDRLDFWAEGGTLELPNAWIQVFYSAGRHNYGGPCTNRSDCFWLNELYPARVDDLDPDIAAPLTFEAYRKLRDPAVDAVLERERRRFGDRG